MRNATPGRRQVPTSRPTSPKGTPKRAGSFSRKGKGTLAKKAIQMVGWFGPRATRLGVDSIGGHIETIFNLSWRQIACHLIALFLGMGFVLPLLLQLFDRKLPIVLSNPVLSPNPVVPGGSISVTWDAEERRNCDGEIRRTIIDSAGHVFSFTVEPTQFHVASRNSHHFSAPTQITPLSANEGPAVYIVNIRRWCNFMQQIFWPLEETRKVHFEFGPNILKEHIDKAEPPE